MFIFKTRLTMSPDKINVAWRYIFCLRKIKENQFLLSIIFIIYLLVLNHLENNIIIFWNKTRYIFQLYNTKECLLWMLTRVDRENCLIVGFHFFLFSFYSLYNTALYVRVEIHSINEKKNWFSQTVVSRMLELIEKSILCVGQQNNISEIRKFITI